MSDTTFRILGVSGSLRKHSFNTGLLVAAQEVAPTSVSVAIADISRFPLYNDDDNHEGGPEIVRDFRAQIRAADALLLATPEYNYSVSGVLKNAIDWASRPVASSPLRFKPLALMGVGGQFGTARSQLAWRQIFSATESYPLLRPELMVVRGDQHFDAEGKLTDEVIRERVGVLIEALVVWARRLRAE